MFGLETGQLAYGGVALLAVLSAYCLGGYKRRGVSSAIFLLWVLNIFYTEVTGDFTPILFFAVGDCIVGSFVILTATSKWQRGIGAWFIAMMLAHISFWVQEPQTYGGQVLYWMIFTTLGWGQLCHVVTWIYKDIGVRFFTDLTKNTRMDVDV